MSFLKFRVTDKFDQVKELLIFEKVTTDNWVFRLHYKIGLWLVFLFVACYTFVLTKMPVSCISNMVSAKGKWKYGMGAFREEVSSYCWTTGTYVVLNADPDREMYPGVVGITGAHDEIYYQRYYKWMSVYLVVMHVLLLIPRYIWRSIERGVMKILVGLVDVNKFLLHKEDLSNDVEEQAVEFLYSHLGHFKEYAMGFILCEVLNIIMATILLIILDYIADHEFWMNGASFTNLMMDRSLRTDRMAKVFPLVAKCTFNHHGPGGNIQPNEFLCTLPMNVLTELVVVFLWYYFIVLIICGIGSLVFRLMAIVVRPLRTRMLAGMLTMVSTKQIRTLSDKCAYSDWFFIRRFGSNVEPVTFRRIVEKLIVRLEN